MTKSEDGDSLIFGRVAMMVATFEEIQKNSFIAGWRALEEADLRDPTCSDETIEEAYREWVEKNTKEFLNGPT